MTIFRIPEQSVRGEAEFAGQFRISVGSEPPPAGAERRRLGDWTVDFLSPLEAVDVTDVTGRSVGLLLGIAIDTDVPAILDGTYRIPTSVSATTNVDAFVEDHIYRLAGSFLFILATDEFQRVYLDPNGSRSLVFDPEAKVAAATTAFALGCPILYGNRFRRRLYRELNVEREGWIPAGLTAHRGVERLMPNHYLDLTTWCAVRHWPCYDIVHDSQGGTAIVALVEEIRRVIEVVTRREKACMALTAGYDTRLLLACAKPFHQKLDFVTVDAPGEHLDVFGARKLARRFNLRHQVMPFRAASSEEKELWRKRVSHCLTGINLAMHPSVQSIERRIFLGGVGGEVGRGALWLNSEEGTPLDVFGLLVRLRLPRHPALIERLESWLESVKEMDTLLKLDLAFIELRAGSWAFAQSYALPWNFEINPLISRKAYRAMLSLPAAERRKHGMVIQAINHAWPELLEVPINRYGDLRDQLAKLWKAVTNPRNAVRKFRRLGSVRILHATVRIRILFASAAAGIMLLLQRA